MSVGGMTELGVSEEPAEDYMIFLTKCCHNIIDKNNVQMYIII